MAEGGIRDFHQAKLKAAARLGEHDDSALPRNSEVETALREYQRLFQSDSQPQLLRRKREAASSAMTFLRRFEPRLVGAVADGTADEHSPVALHLHSDDASEVTMLLQDTGIPFDESDRRLRLDRERSLECPVFLFAADGVSMDLTVVPRDVLRQAPLDRAERPMMRLSLSALQARLAEEDILAFESERAT
jgi:hypothetical protein